MRISHDSIARAKAAQQRERDEVYRITGLRVTDAGVQVPPVVVLSCRQPGCTFPASATTEGGAIRSLAAHIVGVHLEKGA